MILLTLASRVILLPLSIKSTRSMREMQVIQPEIKRLQKKYKGDRQKLNTEMMALYKEHGVNPFGGCAPLLLQFPVLIGLFYVIRTPLAYMGFEAPGKQPSGILAAPADFVARNVSGFLETLQESRLAESLMDRAVETFEFLSLNLACSASGILQPPSATALDQATDNARELTLSCGRGIGSAIPYLVLVLLMGFTTWYQQKQMQSKQDPANPQAAQMQMLGRIMPVMLMFFAYSFPTGVVLYWLTTNIWTIGQQRVIMQNIPTPTPISGKEKTNGDKAKGSVPPASEESESPSARSKPHPSSKKRKRK
ncbi:MAG: YidC/Oxa1 family membrane protein insertase [Actinomycetota bacterium]|nr:YidC/Oxa1 family membrane protein insertase [Actinomycetota bacterium]